MRDEGPDESGHRSSGTRRFTVMKIEILFAEGCPNVERARVLVSEVLREEGIDDPIEEIRVDTDEEARRLRFPGTPTVRIDGLDVDKRSRDAEAFGLAPRLYIRSGMITGCPTRGAIRDAVLEARARAAGGS
jgi:hypothetical protein